MISVLPSAAAAEGSVEQKLAFQHKLQALANKIHSTTNVDEIMVELSQELCDLFEADRLTIYITSEDKSSIVSKVKTGLHSFKDIKLPINEQSIKGEHISEKVGQRKTSPG